jgi:hypothetical protein
VPSDALVGDSGGQSQAQPAFNIRRAPIAECGVAEGAKFTPRELAEAPRERLISSY